MVFRSCGSKTCYQALFVERGGGRGSEGYKQTILTDKEALWYLATSSNMRTKPLTQTPNPNSTQYPSTLTIEQP